MYQTLNPPIKRKDTKNSENALPINDKVSNIKKMHIGSYKYVMVNGVV